MIWGNRLRLPKEVPHGKPYSFNKSFPSQFPVDFLAKFRRISLSLNTIVAEFEEDAKMQGEWLRCKTALITEASIRLRTD